VICSIRAAVSARARYLVSLHRVPEQDSDRNDDVADLRAGEPPADETVDKLLQAAAAYLRQTQLGQLFNYLTI
jgi:hypothetical protein